MLIEEITHTIIRMLESQSENFEQSHHQDSDYFINTFKDLSPETIEPDLFRNLESELTSADFELASQNDVVKVLNDNALLCRSEDFRSAMDLITAGESIEISNNDQHANMCSMSSSKGYRVAMEEGFGNKEINAVAKVVLTFHDSNIDSRDKISADDDLWRLKPETASVSIAGSGTVTSEDVEMISFRFPIHLYPEQLLTDAEADMLEDTNLPFIVRHYVKNRKNTH